VFCLHKFTFGTFQQSFCIICGNLPVQNIYANWEADSQIARKTKTFSIPTSNKTASNSKSSYIESLHTQFINNLNLSEILTLFKGKVFKKVKGGSKQFPALSKT